jgi:hypothetical protein
MVISIEEIIHSVEYCYYQSTDKLTTKDIPLYKEILVRYSAQGNIRISKDEFDRLMLENTAKY